MTSIKYELADGREIEIEVTDEVAELSIQLEREISNHSRNERNRKNKSIEAMAEYGAEIADVSQDVEAESEKNQLGEMVKQAIEKLSVHQQTLVRSFYFEEKTLRAIAEEQGISEQAAGQQLKTIHKKLKKLLEKAFSFEL